MQYPPPSLPPIPPSLTPLSPWNVVYTYYYSLTWLYNNLCLKKVLSKKVRIPGQTQPNHKDKSREGESNINSCNLKCINVSDTKYIYCVKSMCC